LPEIRERAAETEKLGRMPDENIHAMTEAGIFRAVCAAPPGSPPEDSTGDIIQKAANGITLKDYQHLYA